MTQIDSQVDTQEIQDSLIVLDAIRSELGVPSSARHRDEDDPTQTHIGWVQDNQAEDRFEAQLLSTEDRACSATGNHAQQTRVAGGQPSETGVACRDQPASPQKQQSSIRNPPRDVTHHNPPPPTHIEFPRSHEPSYENDNDDPSLRPHAQPAGAVVPAVKMDISQQTPTQVNEDRDYDAVCHSLPSSRGLDDTLDPEMPTEATGDRTLQTDDTGAVNFGNFSEFGRPSSQVSEDGGFENTRGEWRESQQQYSNNAYTPFKQGAGAAVPETPALPKNPFGSKPSMAAPLVGSQLFGQTQFSSAVKPLRISPTSSRPSPNIGHVSYSPQAAETSPLKNRANISSPTDVGTSSPGRLEDAPKTARNSRPMERIEEETPSAARSSTEEAIPASPSTRLPRSSAPRQPQVRYESVQKSQERKVFRRDPYEFVGSDSEDDTLRRAERQRQVERRKAKATQETAKVKVPSVQISIFHSEAPSSRKKRRLSLRDKENLPVPGAAETAPEPSKSSNEPPVVVDSQQRKAASNAVPVTSSTRQGTGTPPPVPEVPDAEAQVPTNEDEPDLPPELDDRIPATSPAMSPDPTLSAEVPQLRSEPDLPRLDPDLSSHLNPSTELGTSSVPLVRRPPQKNDRRASRRNVIVTSSASEVPCKEAVTSTDQATDPAGSPASTASPPREEVEKSTADDPPHIQSTEDGERESRETSPAKPTPHAVRSSGRKRTPTFKAAAEQGRASSVNSDAATASSDTSMLSSALPSSVLSTPSVLDSPQFQPARAVSATLQSPVEGSLRKQALRLGDHAAHGSRAKRQRRSVRDPKYFHESQSTDELQVSPSPSVLERSVVHTKSVRSSKPSLAPLARCARLLDGMVFALSFQATGSKAQDRTKLEARIEQAGGSVLSEGFDVLFERSPIMGASELTLDLEDATVVRPCHLEKGFTALIADGHSRKAKYMQALALGFPCLAPQWIQTCLTKGTLVDWEPYLLCAGASAVLGNALRSRSLAPCPPEETSLCEIVRRRRKLLEGQRLLIVVDSKKARSDLKEPYMFLMQALGARTSRVHTAEQACEVLTKHARAETPIDWVYIDSGTATVEAVLCAPEAGGKKRKRTPAVAAPLFGNIRVLNDELVVQSLILGRMVEDGEMSG
ncbi:uncharacterized protein J7T54_008133 [Emericellopsis cladophorae]|uniref:BRCT domain-containing protein n=1 Tax=Emericellopsis cladophorae TaxID=2686198 RepID=A0A9P9Y928_9HYPO|nr:uncharacterized protein J7T54_008133 [Emericellopsis cladophorae]KAI6785039.1 hypothetical protein J7T54_008133 [Emericellopsis cladophorae]